MKKRMLGFIFAPLVAVSSIALIIAVEGIIGKLQNLNYYDKPTIGILIIAIFMYGLPLSYLAASIVGIPSVFLLKKRTNKLWGFSFVGLGIGIIAGILGSMLLRFPTWLWLGTILLSIVYSCVAYIAYWAIDH